MESRNQLPPPGQSRWQRRLYDLCFVSDRVNPKVLARALGKTRTYISDICRRERVDTMRIFNTVLRFAASHAKRDDKLLHEIATPVGDLLTEGTRFQLEYVDEPEGDGADCVSLCEQTGVMCMDIGAAIQALARIEADGRYDEQDDADVAKFRRQAALVIRRLRTLSVELGNRRAAGAKR